MKKHDLLLVALSDKIPTAELRMEECKQSARWQHLSRLKASAFFTLVVKKLNNLNLGFVTSSCGW
jgi:hypothetical protein